MAARSALVIVAGEVQQLQAGDTLAGASGGAGLTLSTVEIDLGATARRSGYFTITGSGLTTSKPVAINKAVGPYTGKGSLADEAEMDAMTVSASVVNATTIKGYWASPTHVRGNHKFNYQVSA